MACKEFRVSYKFFSLFVLGFAFGTLSVCCTVDKKDSINLYKRATSVEIVEDIAYKSTIRLHYTDKNDNVVSAASGFAIDVNTFMTAGHFCISLAKNDVLGKMKDFKIIYINNNHQHSEVGGVEIATIDEKKDLCTIKKRNHGIVPLYFAKNYQTRVHDYVVMSGAPRGLFPTTSVGRVIYSKFDTDESSLLDGKLVVSAIGTYGNSGGPILNMRGEVIGVVSAKIPDYDGVIFAVHLDTIKKYIDEEGIKLWLPNYINKKELY